MKVIREFTRVFDGTLNILAVLAAVLLLLIMLVVCAEVIMRYLLSRPLTGLIEVTQYCLLFITFLATAWALRKEGHVKIDLLVSRLNQRAQAFLDIATSFLGAIICLTVTWLGVWVTWDMSQKGYKMATELEPPQYLILFIIPVGSFLLFIQFLRRTYGYVARMKALLNMGNP